MIIYIHGFGSHGEGWKAKVLRDFCHNHSIRFIAPSLSTIPDLAVGTLEELIESYQKIEKVYLVGSSLGGYYALYLSHKYDLPCVLINPAVYAYRTLERALGNVPNYYDQSSYEWTSSHLKMLQNYEVDKPLQEKCLLMVQTGDEVLDYAEAVRKLPQAKQIVEEGGDHGFSGFERHCGSIMDFFGF